MTTYSPYQALQRDQYTHADVLYELQNTGGWRPPHGSAPTAAMESPDYRSYAAQQQQPVDGYPGYPAQYPIGARGYPEAMIPPGFDSSLEGREAVRCSMNEHIIDSRIEAPQYQGYRTVEQGFTWGAKPYVTIEKVVDVPQIIVKERVREVPKPVITERIIEVPKTEFHEHTVEVPEIQYVEEIKEVPQIVTEDRVVHVPKLVVQERIIEVPKIEFRERIEYEDRVEYREVPVDKIVEVPEIEYKVKEVEVLVPQPYMQEYLVEKYEEVPVVQVQEVERIEEVPVVQYRQVPRNRTVQVPTYRQTYDTYEQKEMPKQAVQQQVVMPPVQQQAVMQSYKTYDPAPAPAQMVSQKMVMTPPMPPQQTITYASQPGSFTQPATMMPGTTFAPGSVSVVPGSMSVRPGTTTFGSMPQVTRDDNPFSIGGSAQMSPQWGSAPPVVTRYDTTGETNPFASGTYK